MKKAKAAAALIAAISSVSMLQAFPASAAESIRLMGDMDGDLKITALDAQITLTIYAEAIVGNSDNTADAENGSADINMDGVIDVNDAQNILLYYCQTLVGDQPLWADFREVSYRGTDGNQTNPGNSSSPFVLQGMYMEIGCAQGAPGEVVDVPVYIAGVDEMAGFQMFVAADEGLTLLDIIPGLASETQGREYDPEVDGPLQNDRLPLTVNPEWGAVTWAQARNYDPRDGQVLATFRYQIPEDAESGDIYRVFLNNDAEEGVKTMFITRDFEAYEFTLLEGVVVVE